MRLYSPAVAATLSLAALLVAVAPAGAEPWDGGQRWGIGVHATAMGLGPAEDSEADAFAMGGLGVQVRYRLHRRWEFEAELDHVAGKLESGDLSREVRSLLLNAMFHINPGSQWTWTLVGGLGGGRDDIEFVEISGKQRMTGEASFAHGHFHVGVALERRFSNIGVAAQLRAVGVTRNEEELDGPAFEGMDVPTPRNESGGRFNLLVTYYF
jgi:hypothetical protein